MPPPFKILQETYPEKHSYTHFHQSIIQCKHFPKVPSHFCPLEFVCPKPRFLKGNCAIFSNSSQSWSFFGEIDLIGCQMAATDLVTDTIWSGPVTDLIWSCQDNSLQSLCFSNNLYQCYSFAAQVMTEKRVSAKKSILFISKTFQHYF